MRIKRFNESSEESNFKYVLRKVPFTVDSWKAGDKYTCPECYTELSQPYKCEQCNIQLVPKVRIRT